MTGDSTRNGRRVDEGRARAIETFAEIQRRSLHAASSLVERLVATVDGSAAAAGPDGAATGATAPSPVDELVEGWAKLWRDSVTGLAAAVPLTGGPAARLDLAVPAPPTTLAVQLDPAGTGSVEVWVHNPTGEAIDRLRVHCATPQAHDGGPLEPCSIAVDPERFDLPARSSRGILLTVEAGGAAAGTYRTLVLVDGLPDQWLPLEVHVPAADP